MKTCPIRWLFTCNRLKYFLGGSPDEFICTGKNLQEICKISSDFQSFQILLQYSIRNILSKFFVLTWLILNYPEYASAQASPEQLQSRIMRRNPINKWKSDILKILSILHWSGNVLFFLQISAVGPAAPGGWSGHSAGHRADKTPARLQTESQ